MKNDQARSGATAIADRIADALFTNGAGQKAKRLVLELEDGGADGGGWCRAAVAAVVQRILEERPTVADGGWICCCKGPIADPSRPAETMTCCGVYEWTGNTLATPYDYARLVARKRMASEPETASPSAELNRQYSSGFRHSVIGAIAALLFWALMIFGGGWLVWGL